MVYLFCALLRVGGRAQSNQLSKSPRSAKRCRTCNSARGKSPVPNSALPPCPNLQALVTSTELKGFLLTRHWRDAPAGTEIEYWL
ncbi:hypothetical protein, partial [Variovorax beijingensis]|uniref:hypothetical protein n=1 Tax=Variovorax beijingensis TaxID=2496117 RepID=UPI003F696CB2